MRGNPIRASILVQTLACSLAAGVVAAQDHPLITPYEGSKLFSKSAKEYDAYEIPLGVRVGIKYTRSENLEGRVTRLEYRTPRERSALEVYRNYEAAFAKAGFQPLFTCAGEGRAPGMCGTIGGRYLATKLDRPQGAVYIALRVVGYQTVITIVELKPMESGKVKVSAEALSTDIARAGHVAVYEILFDNDKADVKPESEPALGEIARLLKDRPTLKIHVVGHTDSTGSLDHNLDLSRRRAGSVVAALTTKYGIAAARLRPDGVGPLSPVATNRTEEGRARNRRVELVEQ